MGDRYAIAFVTDRAISLTGDAGPRRRTSVALHSFGSAVLLPVPRPHPRAAHEAPLDPYFCDPTVAATSVTTQRSSSTAIWYRRVVACQLAV